MSQNLKEIRTNQERILKLIGKVWEKYPEQRLGQLICNYAFCNASHAQIGNVWTLQNEELEANFSRELNRLLGK